MQFSAAELFIKMGNKIYRAHYGDTIFVLLSGAQIWQPEIMQTSGFSIATNLISCLLRTSKLLH